jgi:hypothetical protein
MRRATAAEASAATLIVDIYRSDANQMSEYMLFASHDISKSVGRVVSLDYKCIFVSLANGRCSWSEAKPEAAHWPICGPGAGGR